MAKKVRRVKKKRKKTTASATQQANGAEVVTVMETAVEAQLSTREQFRLEYAYVVKDLRRVLLLATLLFGLLIALNLLLQ